MGTSAPVVKTVEIPITVIPLRVQEPLRLPQPTVAPVFPIRRRVETPVRRRTVEEPAVREATW